MLLFCRFVVHLVVAPSLSLSRYIHVSPSLILPFSHLYWSVRSSMPTIFSFRFGLFLFSLVSRSCGDALRRAAAFFCCLDSRSRRPSSTFLRQSILDPVRFTATWQRSPASVCRPRPRPPRYIVLCFAFGARCGAFEYQFVVSLGGNCVHCVVHCGCFLPAHVGIVPRYTRPFAVDHGAFAVCLCLCLIGWLPVSH